MAFTGTSKVDVNFISTRPTDLSTPKDSLVFGSATPYKITWSDGEGANQGEEMWHDQRTIAASANEELDLYDGLIDPKTVAETLTFTKLKYVLIINRSTAGGDGVLEVGGAASNAWLGNLKAQSDIVQVFPGGGHILFVAPDANGMTVGASNYALKIANVSGGSYSATYDITVVGTI